MILPLLASFGFVPGNEIFIKTDEKLNNLALEVAKELNIKLRAGIIATGDEFICDEAKKAKIEKFSMLMLVKWKAQVWLWFVMP